MVDQCTHCIFRGDIDRCMAATCSKHDDWIVKAYAEEQARKARRETLEEAANTCRGLLPTTAQLDEMERHGMSFSSATRMCHDAIRELMDTRRDGE